MVSILKLVCQMVNVYLDEGLSWEEKAEEDSKRRQFKQDYAERPIRELAENMAKEVI